MSKGLEIKNQIEVIGDKDSFLSSNNFDHWAKVSKVMASSDMVPKAYKNKAPDILIAMEMGRQWNIGPLQAIQNIAVINGRPCAYGDLVLAICSAHPDFENIEEVPIFGKNDEIIGYKCSVKRRGRSCVMQTFTVQQAKEGGLWGKQGPWKTSSARMLQMRARAFALRDSFADALMGVSIREEVEDYIDAEYKVVEGSRTEFLKKDLLTKKEGNAETINEPSDMDTYLENRTVAEEATKNESETLGETRSENHSPSNKGPEVSAITPQQVKTIMQLLDEKGFDEERRTRAFSYYEVTSIAELTTDLADYFIAHLNKL